jgi:hypothetical protein
MINPLNELSNVYLSQISEQESDNTPEDVKTRVMQIVKAIRYKARKEGGNIVKAFNDYMGGQSGIGAAERQMVKQRLGLQEEVGISSSAAMEKAKKEAALRKKEAEAVEKAKKVKEENEVVDEYIDTVKKVKKAELDQDLKRWGVEEDYETKKKGEVLKALDKKKFVKRYGKDKAPDIMYAVAAKTAKKKGDTSKSDDRYAYEEFEDAVEYFYAEGINAEGIDLIIEEVGLDDFVDFVTDTEFLSEERAARKMNVRTLKATKKKAEEIKADKSDVVKKPGLKDVLSRARTERSFKKPQLAKPAPKKEAPKPVVKKVEKAVAKVKPTQPKKEVSKGGLRDKIKSAVAAGTKRHRKATQPIRVFHKGMKKAPKAVAKAVVDVKKAVVGEGFSNWREDLREVADDIPETDKKMDVKIKEKKVKNKIVINPVLGGSGRDMGEEIKKIGGELLEMNAVEEQLAAGGAVPLSPQEVMIAKRQAMLQTRASKQRQRTLAKVKGEKPGEEVKEEKKTLPKLKMYRKAGNLARAGDEKSMKRQTKMVSVLNKETEKGYKKAALDKLRDGGSPKHQTEEKGFNFIKKFMKEDEALAKVKSDIIKKYGKGAIYDPKNPPKSKPLDAKQIQQRDNRNAAQREVDAQYGRTPWNKKGSLGT